jgi:glucose uptake protein GlcU
MDSMTMLQTALALFLVAAVGGVAMAAIRFKGARNPPAWLAMLHGLLAGAGLTLLLYAAWVAGVPALAQLAAGLFVLAAAGGVFLNLAYHQRGRPLPKGIVAVHGVLAVVGFLLLWLAAFP